MVRVWRMEPSAIWGISMEGALLRHEPSMMRGVFVEGSGLENGTVREMGH